MRASRFGFVHKALAMALSIVLAFPAYPVVALAEVDGASDGVAVEILADGGDDVGAGLPGENPVVGEDGQGTPPADSADSTAGPDDGHPEGEAAEVEPEGDAGEMDPESPADVVVDSEEELPDAQEDQAQIDAGPDAVESEPPSDEAEAGLGEAPLGAQSSGGDDALYPLTAAATWDEQLYSAYKATLLQAKQGQGVFQTLYKGYGADKSAENRQMWIDSIAYSLFDMNLDGTPELFIRTGWASLGTLTHYFTYKGGQVVRLGQEGIVSWYGNSSGQLFSFFGRQGSSRVNLLTISGSSLVVKEVFRYSDFNESNYEHARGYLKGRGASELETSSVTNYSLLSRLCVRWFFCDVNERTPHADDVEWVGTSGISAGWGMADGTRQYRPYANVARADMAAFLYRLAGSPSYTTSAATRRMFSDVTSSTPHAKEVWWLASKGISTGFPDGTFRPYASVARCDMAAFLYRLAGSPSYTPSAATRRAFSDVTGSTPHAKEVWWLASKGVSTGFSDGTFRPYNNVARADMAAFLHRMDELV